METVSFWVHKITCRVSCQVQFLYLVKPGRTARGHSVINSEGAVRLTGVLVVFDVNRSGSTSFCLACSSIALERAYEGKSSIVVDSNTSTSSSASIRGPAWSTWSAVHRHIALTVELEGEDNNTSPCATAARITPTSGFSVCLHSSLESQHFWDFKNNTSSASPAYVVQAITAATAILSRFVYRIVWVRSLESGWSPTATAPVSPTSRSGVKGSLAKASSRSLLGTISSVICWYGTWLWHKTIKIYILLYSFLQRLPCSSLLCVSKLNMFVK